MTDVVEIAKQIRDGASDVAWVAFKVDPDTKEFVSVASGPDVSGISSYLDPSERTFFFSGIFLDEDKGGLELKKADALGRRKFVLITWTGEEVPARVRATALEVAPLVREAVGHVHVEISTSEAEELTTEEITRRAKLASGAFYDSGATNPTQSVAVDSVGKTPVRATGEDIVRTKSGARGAKRLVGRPGKAKLAGDSDEED